MRLLQASHDRPGMSESLRRVVSCRRICDPEAPELQASLLKSQLSGKQTALFYDHCKAAFPVHTKQTAVFLRTLLKRQGLMPCTAIWFLNALHAILIGLLLLCNRRPPLTAPNMALTLWSLCRSQ